MKNVLVIGDDSYIGINIYNWIMNNTPPHTIVNITSSRNYKWKENFPNDCDVVINVAGLAHIKNITEEMRPQFYAINRDLVIEIGGWAKNHGVRHFVHFSSMNVYGDYCDDLQSRECENPTSFYGDSKYQGDLGLKELECDTFKVSYVRPPFVYGKGCRGNYNTVSRLAKKVPLFPDYPNKKSMIYIDNLCEFVRLVIDNELDGVLTPQNKELVSTATLMRTIAKVNGKSIWLPKMFNPFLRLGVRMTRKLRRVVGNDNYDMALSNYFDFKYCVVDFEESIKRTEN